MSTQTKSADLRIRLLPDDLKRLSSLAAEDDRTISDYARRILTTHIEEATA